MTTLRATAAEWVREVAADRWDSLLAAQGFGRSATALDYVRKVADGGRQRLHLDLERRSEGIHLSLRATVAFPTVAKLATRLLGSAVPERDAADSCAATASITSSGSPHKDSR